MKRIGSLFEQINTLENLKCADKKARRGKLNQYGVQRHIKNEEKNLYNLQQSLLNREFTTSKYSTFILNEGKERIISRLPYYPDRILQHSVINILEPIFYSVFTSDTYSCVKGRGVHKASYNLRSALKDKEGTKYCLKLDIKKFYPSINNEILKQLLRRKFKDKDLLWILDDIIDSSRGLPLGNITSQFLANFYLTYFDHWVKEELKIKYFFRYCDDMVILSSNKEDLHEIFHKIKNYLSNLKLEVKGNYQIFPTDVRGIDFVGYKHFTTHILIRKSIKKKYIKNKNKKSHFGWLKHCNSINLRRKYENNN